ncbi:hypothetical protein BT63DRAFT_423522 [Microthyrium microscopicum]|uniref:Uncharacterized protein n=1 Tax=Microthyrium microscopicum TaxID=703497 RepID=A0A6A6UIM2_9PEZI|nr:hypothetical protein BT63DRAFT_423522 [Microthyrium microscopicum]
MLKPAIPTTNTILYAQRTSTTPDPHVPKTPRNPHNSSSTSKSHPHPHHHPAQ